MRVAAEVHRPRYCLEGIVMPIIHHKGGGTTITDEAMVYYRMCVLRSAVGLEMSGLKVRRGPVVWKQVAKEFNIKGNKAAVYQWLCETVDDLRPLQEHIGPEGVS